MEETLVPNILYAVALGSLAVTFMVGAVLLFFILYQKRMIRNIEEKQELESSYQKSLLSSFIETQENERQRIAADLHDGIGAALAGIKLMLNQFKPESEADKELLHECKDAIQKTASSAREISHDLLPPALETIGLVRTLERMAKNLSSSSLIIKTNCLLNYRLDKKIELALYRITQELINNTIKYAQASVITIELVEKEEGIFFQYFDNGIGFDKKGHNGLGLKNIESRVQMIEGTIEFFSEPNKQTGVKIYL